MRFEAGIDLRSALLGLQLVPCRPAVTWGARSWAVLWQF